jgi:hypothetical protein
MALFTYIQQALLFLNDAGVATFNTADLTTYINLGRQQIAASGECIRAVGTLVTASGTQQYAFSSITIGTSGASAGGVLVVRNVNVPSAIAGYGPMTNRNFDWFTLFYIQNSAAQSTGRPNTWSQYGRGTSGQIYFNPVPAAAYTCTVDCVVLPNNLALDSDAEALPYPWTDAVAWYAAYYAAVTVQNFDAAKTFMDRFEEYMHRAVSASTPSILPENFPGGLAAKIASSKQTLVGSTQQQNKGR